MFIKILRSPLVRVIHSVWIGSKYGGEEWTLFLDFKNQKYFINDK